MEVDKLALPLRDWVLRLKYASGTIEADVWDALEESHDQEEFVKRSEDAIWSLIGECKDWLNHLKRAEAMLRDQSPRAAQVGRGFKSREIRGA